MSGSRTAGPTLAIGGGAPVPNNSTSMPTPYTNNNGAMQTTKDYVSNSFSSNVLNHGEELGMSQMIFSNLNMCNIFFS
jgi:hypothetical protein